MKIEETKEKDYILVPVEEMNKYYDEQDKGCKAHNTFVWIVNKCRKIKLTEKLELSDEK